MCGKVIGEKQCSVIELYGIQAQKRGISIANDHTHVMNQYFQPLPSGRRYCVLKYKTQRFNKSFVNQAIHFMNSKSV